MRRDLRLELAKNGQISNDIGVEDAFEIGLRATEYLRSLAFLTHHLDLSGLKEDEGIDLNFVFMSLGEMIYGFSSQAFWMLDILENSRKETQNSYLNKNIWFIAGLVLNDNIEPEQALLLAKQNGLKNLPDLDVFQHFLREQGFGRRNRKSKN